MRPKILNVHMVTKFLIVKIITIFFGLQTRFKSLNYDQVWVGCSQKSWPFKWPPKFIIASNVWNIGHLNHCKYHFVGDMNVHNEKLLMWPNRRQEWELLMKNKWGKFNEHQNYTHATYTQRKMKIVPHGCNLCITSK